MDGHHPIFWVVDAAYLGHVLFCVVCIFKSFVWQSVICLLKLKTGTFNDFFFFFFKLVFQEVPVLSHFNVFCLYNDRRKKIKNLAFFRTWIFLRYYSHWSKAATIKQFNIWCNNYIDMRFVKHYVRIAILGIYSYV